MLGSALRFDLPRAAPHRDFMNIVFDAFAKAFGQLTDKAVLRVLVKSVLVTLVVFAIGGGLVWWLVDSTLQVWLIPFLPENYQAPTAAFLAAFLWLVSFWLLFRVIALAVLQFFADEIVAAVEAKHYSAAALQARPLPFRHDLANSVRGFGRALGVNLLAMPFALVLLVTGIGPAILFLTINAWLLGRELTDMTWLRHCGEDMAGNPVPRAQRIMLGGVIAAIMVVPFAALLAPILGAAAGTHLAHAAMSDKGLLNDPKHEEGHA